MYFLRLSMNGKLLCAAAFLLGAIGLLSRLLIEQSFKDIDFAAKERDGIVYARTVWPIQVAANLADTLSPSQTASLAATLAKSAAGFDAAMTACSNCAFPASSHACGPIFRSPTS